jgi:hypothetical protein
MDKIVEKIVKKLISEVKKEGIDPKLIAWIEDKYGPWNDKDFISDDGDTYFKTDKINKETGSVSHTIINLPSFSELIKQLKITRDAANELIRGESVRDDEVLRDIYNEQRKIFNKFRTHLRKEYPAFYAQLKGQLTEEELDEMSTTGGGAGSSSFTPGTGMQYATPYAFKKVKKQKLPESKVNEGASKEDQLKVAKAAFDKAEKDGDIRKQELALAAIDLITGTIDEGVGASLGPGPKASEDGVKDNAYVKQFGYKLVPKKIKGSGLEVKQLFEKEDASDFQNRRIQSFDRIEQEMNDIYKMLSNAKNETSDYYNENPGSYSVVKPTDLVLDYIKDIKDLLKGE